jgi:hypothetical protein
MAVLHYVEWAEKKGDTNSISFGTGSTINLGIEYK